MKVSASGVCCYIVCWLRYGYVGNGVWIYRFNML